MTQQTFSSLPKLLLIFSTFSLQVVSISFNFRSLTLDSLKLLGDAHLKNGTIRLSRDLAVPNSGAGRALYADAVRLRHPATRRLLPFSTFFSFSVTDLNPSSSGGGLAFLLAPDADSVGDAGGFLGLLNATGDPSDVVAVEFDTLMDDQFDDINGNHVGVDLGSMLSAQAVDLDIAGIDLKTGETIHAWIEYGGASAGMLEVFVSYSADRPPDPLMSFTVDLGQYVDDFVYVGFSGSTQGSTEIHSIEWWSFSSPSFGTSPKPPPLSTPSTGTVISPPVVQRPPSSPGPTVSIAAASEGPSVQTVSRPETSSCQNNSLCRQGPGAVAGVATAGAFVVAALAGAGFWVFVSRRRKTPSKWDALAGASEIVSGPRQFSYRELSAATRGFDSSRVIGHGAFGTVYKGIIPETGAMVAVKRCIQNGGDGNGDQGRAEFLSELAIIASLRHRNLVRLQGWCQEKGEILLVYDYMVFGSLDKALFDQAAPPLAWRHRKKILIGVASALAYLHRECERQVIHRDVKSSNVMLDEGYHARLGDFGLARQVEHDMSPDATVTAGTMGYLAPEYLLTGRATEKTDVFSFGAVVLEVACGRRPINGDDNRNVVVNSGTSRRCSNLVEWVWRLHGEGRILEAVDRRLEGEFDEGEMRRVLLVGLACSSPDAMLRPAMRNVVQMLNGEADPPFVPVSKPSMSFSTNHQLLLSLQDSVSDYNGMGLRLSDSSSSSSSSLRTTLKYGGGAAAGE